MSTSAPGQLFALVGLRRRMVRGTSARIGLSLALLSMPLLAACAVLVGANAPTGQETDLTLLTPSILLAFLALAIVAPLAAGGATELYPPDQLVAFPIRPRTVFRAGLLLAPLNLAWLLQVLAALGLTAYVVNGSSAAIGAAMVTMLVYLALVTVAGQGIAWSVVGLRQHRLGRIACWVALGVTAAVFVVLLLLGELIEAFDRAPTRWVFFTSLKPSDGLWSEWLIGTAALALACAIVLACSERACRWALSRAPDRGAAGDSQVLTRRPFRDGDERRALVELTRRGLWRTRPVRRGALLLALLPGALLAAAQVGWDSLILLPGLVGAGAGMLFGINAFCLDGSGATWIATLPHRASVTFWARTQVVAEVTAVIVVVSVAAGALRAPAPTAAELVCFVAALAIAVLRVTAASMRLSVTRPHRAELLGPRDAPAPPGTMAIYSVRLAGSGALVGTTFGIAAQVGSVPAALVLAAIYGGFGARSLRRTARAWADPVVRAKVVATVSAG